MVLHDIYLSMLTMRYVIWKYRHTFYEKFEEKQFFDFAEKRWSHVWKMIQSQFEEKATITCMENDTNSVFSSVRSRWGSFNWAMCHMIVFSSNWLCIIFIHVIIFSLRSQKIVSLWIFHKECDDTFRWRISLLAYWGICRAIPEDQYWWSYQ